MYLYGHLSSLTDAQCQQHQGTCSWPRDKSHCRFEWPRIWCLLWMSQSLQNNLKFHLREYLSRSEVRVSQANVRCSWSLSLDSISFTLVFRSCTSAHSKFTVFFSPSILRALALIIPSSASNRVLINEESVEMMAESACSLRPFLWAGDREWSRAENI